MAMQMQALAFDFAEGLVVGLGIKGEEKALLLKKWTEFSSNTFTFVVSARLSCHHFFPWFLCSSACGSLVVALGAVAISVKRNRAPTYGRQSVCQV